MLARASRASLRAFTSSARTLAAPAAAAPTDAVSAELVLTLAVPNRALVLKKAVKRVTIPGRGGTFGLEKNSPTMLSELRPGLVRVDHLDNTVEEYFIPGGFAFKHASNVLDISSPESAALENIDADALRAANSEATKKRDAAAAGSREYVEAALALEVFKSLAQSLKLAL